MGRLAPLAVIPALLLPGCTSAPDPKPTPPPAVPAPAMRLVSYQADCRGLLADLRKAAQESVGPWGFGGLGRSWLGGPEAAMAAGAASDKAAGAAPPAYSGTNVHEAGTDEPDVIKTDGRRIVTVDRGVLRVVDAASRKQTGKLDLDLGEVPGDLLLTGDRALVLSHSLGRFGAEPDTAMKIAPRGGAVLILVDLTGAPRELSRYSIDAELVDARQTGGVARVVVRNAPRITFGDLPRVNRDADRTKAHRATIGKAPVTAWLPEYTLVSGGKLVRERVGCDRVSTPPVFSGASLVTVLTFDLGQAALDDGDPVTVAADGDTIYGTTTSLYVSNDQRWRMWSRPDRRADDESTDLYRFDISGARTYYAAAGKVKGYLLNQYALSEHNGHLRVATTSGSGDKASSAIRVLKLDGGSLREVGAVGGLGKTETIHAVRYLGDQAYVVTFRQTDPLYAVDLRDPAKPVVTGELKIPGYSGHLQPLGPGLLAGVGQDADDRGATRGTQVSLFDVSNPAAPRRLDNHTIPNGWSDAESDPHALLWWPATNLFVVPVQNWESDRPDLRALALRIAGGKVDRVGEVRHPAARGDAQWDAMIRRSLVIGETLWTYSSAGLQANDLNTLDRQAWLATR